MSAKQYKPFSYRHQEIPLIIYPVKDEHPLDALFDRNDTNSIQKYLDDLYKKNKEVLLKGTYHIVFVWNLEETRMADIWVHNMDNFADPGSGPLIDCFIFKDLERSHDAGIASGDGMIVLGREEELRRKFDEIEEYVDREKHIPEFPERMAPTEEYYNK